MRPAERKKNTQLGKWLIAATSEETRALADMVGTSCTYLHALANRDRSASAEMAAAIETAADKIRTQDTRREERLPVLRRYEMNRACAECPYAKAHTYLPTT